MTQEKVAIVTGANRGLGFATARDLASKGYKVILTARTQEKAQKAADLLGEEGVEVQPATLDISDAGSVHAFFEWFDANHSNLDVLVNNAGAIFEMIGQERMERAAQTQGVSADVLEQAFRTNTVGAYRLMQWALPGMNERGYGRIVNVSSGMGAHEDMGSGWPAYRASKSALNALTKVMSHEANDNVLINSVCPGWVQTDMGGPQATRSIEEGIFGIVWAATLPDDGPSGGFFRDGKAIAW